MFGKKKTQENQLSKEERMAEFKLDTKAQIRKLDKSLDKLNKKVQELRNQALEAKNGGNTRMLNNKLTMIKNILAEVNKIDIMKNQLDMVLVNLDIADVSKLFIETVAGLKEVVGNTAINQKELNQATRELERLIDQSQAASDSIEDLVGVSEMFGDEESVYSADEMNELLGLQTAPINNTSSNRVEPVKSFEDMKREMNRNNR